MANTPPQPPPIQSRHLNQTNLSFSQESLWFLQQLDPENNAYNLSYLFKFTGGIDWLTMEWALNELVRRHESFRTIYPNQNGKPMQVIQPFQAFHLDYVDFSTLPEEQRQRAVDKYVSDHGDQPYDLQHGAMVRFALLHTNPVEDYLLYGTHHIMSDGWSCRILINDLMQLYQACLSGNETDLPEVPIQYADYALWQREWLSGDTLRLFIDHWKSVLNKELTVLDLPTDHPRPAMQTYHGARHHLELQPALSAQIQEFCRREHLTPFHFFMAAYAILLMRYSGQEDIIMGCPFANRPLAELGGIIGLFINTLPIRLDLSGNPIVRNLLEQVRTKMLDALDWQAAPFEVLVSEISPQRDLSRTPVFQILVNMPFVSKQLYAIQGLKVEQLIMNDAVTAFDLSLILNDEGDHFNAVVRYNTSLFNQTTILYMTSHFRNILSAMLEEPGKPISELEMLTPTERQRLLLDWNETSSEVPHPSIHELISAQALNNPDASAVICNDRHLTYSALERRSNQLAMYLQAKGLKSEMLVGIFLPRSENLLISQLAIIKAGCAYLPLDLTYPVERLAYMLQDSDPEIIITNSSVGSQIPEQYKKVYLDVDGTAIQACSDQFNVAGTNLETLLYVTYTSGSTGRPKGVMNVQRGVLNYLNHLITTFNLQAGERVIQFTPLSFDASFRDTLGVLAFGGTLFLMDDEQMREPDIICSEINKQKISCILSAVPTMLRSLAHSSLENGVKENHLRLVMSSGEVLQPLDVELVRNGFGRGVQIVNQYGPTECSMISTLFSVPLDFPKDAQVVPIGKPIRNVRVYILDRFLHPVPAGVKGELFIGGIGVGRGYWNRPDLTAERFLPDPFQPGVRVYRTGDDARRLPDGTICFLGRSDNQVKIRGYRVELGEIEAIINEFPGVKEAAVVLLRQDVSESLGAYVSTSNSDKEKLKEDLHSYLADRLPFYMMPSFIMILEEMPLTPNRKIDRRALPSPINMSGQERYLAPRNDTEKLLASIWEEVLGVERVGVRDNFFELGGHSLLAVRLLARIQEEIGRSLPLLLLFKDGTVEGLAACLTGELDLRIPNQGSKP